MSAASFPPYIVGRRDATSRFPKVIAIWNAGFPLSSAVKIFIVLAVSTALGVFPAPSHADPRETDAEITARVDHALHFTSAGLSSKMLNSDLAFHWIGAGDKFWYRKALAGSESLFLVVDAATGKQRPLFDGGAMSKALIAAGAPASDNKVSIQTIAVSDDIRSATVSVRLEEATCRWPVYGTQCTKPTQQFRCTVAVPSCTRLTREATGQTSFSPDGGSEIFVRDYNLWVREVKSGAERRLTSDGVENFSYGRVHIQTDTWAAARRRAHEAKPINGVLWSPDGRYILALRHDLRKTPERLVITEYTPPEGGSPIIHTDRLAVAADHEYPPASLDVIDVSSGSIRHADIDPHTFEDVGLLYFESGRVWWSRRGDGAWIIGTPRGGNEARLIHLDLPTGRTHDVVFDRSERPLLLNPALDKAPNVAVLESSKQLLWYSEKDGWGHLYLYDLETGKPIRQVTRGDWLVADVLRVDEKSRTVFFTAVGKEPGWNPYYRALYKVSLDGGEPSLLTPERADHDFKHDLSEANSDLPGGSISPSGRYIIDSFSTTAQPDKAVIRDTRGKSVADIVTADVSALLATGWRPPESFTVKAADGKTDLWGVIFTPQHLDAAKKYPVIEVTYPGPWWKNSPTMFKDNFTGSTVLNAHAFAELGAIVVAMDGRGNAYRSAEFHGAFYESDDPVGAVDHVTAIRELGATRSYMDLTRVGATGHSSGGDGSFRAMLLYPDFFKVVVSGEGPSDYLNFGMDIAIERELGVPTTPKVFDRYKRIATTNLVSRMKSDNKVLLIYAGADEEVPLQQSFELFAALQKANVLYDTLIVPDAGHWGGRAPYGVMRTLRYFAENLGPPVGGR